MNFLRIFILLSCVGISYPSFSFSGEEINAMEAVDYAKVKLINDTGKTVELKLPGGFVTLKNGESTTFECKIGEKVFVDEKLVRTIGEDDCGKTIKISEWL